MGKVLIIDINRCNGCRNCQIACKDEHCGNDWLPVARSQPLAGQFWTRVVDVVRGTVPKVKVAYLHTLCQHCDPAPCMDACPHQAIYRRPDGIVIIDPLRCKGQRRCLEACPFSGVIFYNDELKISQKCTFCAHLLDRGWVETRCVEACPTGALTFGEEEEWAELIGRACVLNPEANLRPRVYYLGLPKRFIGATVYDPLVDEVIIGADVLINEKGGGELWTCKTDDFGDFWLDGLEPGIYSVVVKKEGYVSRELTADLVEADVNLGDIALERSPDG